MKQAGLANPLGAVNLCTSLIAELKQAGLEATVSADMRLFDDVKQQVRGAAVAPMHHYSTGVFSGERAFWMALRDIESGRTVGLQAYRFDEIDTHLADWCVNYMIGVYMRRQELMVPSHVSPPAGSAAERLTGRIVYHGEAWVDKTVKNRKAVENFVRFGTMLAYLKWNPDCIWALVSAQVARHGHHVIAVYNIIERGFLRWQWASDGIDPVEYLVAVERRSLEAMIEEQLATMGECQPEPIHTPL
jgi:hypothetical protein